MESSKTPSVSGSHLGEAPHWRLKYGVQAQNHDPR
jgi:hypothetical protein